MLVWNSLVISWLRLILLLIGNLSGPPIGLLIGNQHNTPIILNTTNNTTSTPTTVNNTTTTNTQSNKNNNLISAPQAIQIANKLKAKYNVIATGDVDYINAPARGLPGNPYWKLYLKSTIPGDTTTSFVFIDAVTGKEK